MAVGKNGLGALDRAILALAPQWGLRRVRARVAAEVLARHYEAAADGRRTSGWRRTGADANVAAMRDGALWKLREHARSLVSNNEWAVNGCNAIVGNTVGWGLEGKAVRGAPDDAAQEAWKAWANSTSCDADGRLTFAGIQALALLTVVVSGEVLIRRRRRRLEDGLPLPLQLQVLEPDFLDTSKDGVINADTGGTIVQGVEFDKLGRRAAYWLFDQHPGSQRVGAGGFISRRISASEIAHVFLSCRPGQVRGVSWFAPAIVRLKDFDDYEDARLVQQKVAACFAAFVTDPEGVPGTMGGPDEVTGNPLVESLEPGMIQYLAPGKTVQFGTPPPAGDDGFSERTLRRIAAGLGVTYEDMTGDYSQVNFSSARMGRLAHWRNVHHWRWNMLVPQACDPVLGW